MRWGMTGKPFYKHNSEGLVTDYTGVGGERGDSKPSSFR